MVAIRITRLRPIGRGGLRGARNGAMYTARPGEIRTI